MFVDMSKAVLKPPLNNAHFVEFGTDKMTSRETGFHPFMRPAIEATWRECIDEFTDDLDKTLQRTVKRLAKGRK